MLNHPNLAPWPYYEHDEIEAAKQTLISGKVNYWTGDQGKKFEIAYAESVGRKYGIALSNGTVALELALRVLGIKNGDEVIVASRSYVASASCVLMLGAKPVFADIDIDSGNISAETIKPLITNLTKAIIPVHVSGWPCDMANIMELANENNIKVIEDCAQAHGAMIEGKPVGGWGHAAIFSFCQDKIISTGGEGGMLLLDDENAYKNAWAYKDIGRSYDAVYNEVHPVGFRWLTESAGSNFRMTEFQSAIGLLQLKKLPSWIQKRNFNALEIANVIKNFNFIEVPEFIASSGNINAYYRLYAKVRKDFKVAGLSNDLLRDHIVSKLVSAGVPCFHGACSEIYKEKVFNNSNSIIPKERFRNASAFAENAFCFLVHHTISANQLEKLKEILEIELSMLEDMK